MSIFTCCFRSREVAEVSLRGFYQQDEWVECSFEVKGFQLTFKKFDDFSKKEKDRMNEIVRELRGVEGKYLLGFIDARVDDFQKEYPDITVSWDS